jgi:hypothetical protein
MVRSVRPVIRCARLRRWVLAAVVLAACGEVHTPPSDVLTDASIPSDLLIDASDDSYRSLCQAWATTRGWTPTNDHLICRGGIFLALDSPDQCFMRRLRRTQFPDCPLTASDWQRCSDSSPDYCAVTWPEQCRMPTGCYPAGSLGYFNP